MVSSVGTYAQDLINAQLVVQQKQTMDNTLEQVSSGKISQNYEGVASVAGSALGYVQQNSAITNYATDNGVVNVNLNTMQTTLASIQTTMSNFQQTLETYIDDSEQGNLADTQNLQETAFASLQSMSYYLNTAVGNQSLFGGSATTTDPTQFDFSNLAQFQDTYDGYNVSYPDTRAANLSNQTTSVLNTGSLTFNDQNGTISAANVGQFGNIPVGSAITVTGSGSNDGTYTVLANDGTNLTVAHNLVAEGDPTAAPPTPSAVTITTSAYSSNPGVDIQPDVYFDSPNMITAASGSSFSGLQAGDSITISGAANAANNGSFVIASVDPNGGYLTIERPDFATAANNVTAATGDTSATVSYDVGTSTTSLNDSSTGMTFTAAANGTEATVSSSTLTGVPVGGYITIANAADSANDGTYQVTANSSGTLSLLATTQTSLTDETAGSSATISNNSPTAYAPGGMTFSSLSNTILAGTTGSLAGLSVGQTVNVAGTDDNNGSFEVTGVYSDQISTETTPTVADETTSIVANETDSGGTTQIAVVNGSTLNLSNSITFAAGAPAAGTSPTLSGSASDLSSLAAGDVIDVSGTNANNGEFVVSAVSTSGGNTTVTLAAPTILVNGTTAITPANSITFGSGTPPTITGDSSDLDTLAAGDVIDVSGTSSNDGRYVVSGVTTVNGVSTVNLAAAALTVNGTTGISPSSPLTFTANSSAPTLSGSSTDLGSVVAGDSIQVAGTDGNNGTYLVTGVSTSGGVTTLTFAPPDTAIQVSQDESVSTSSYYQGNSQQLSQNVDDNTALDYGVTGSNAAFEKAIRAMALIAEGQLGTAGGLDMNPDRLTQADYLISSALGNDSTESSTSPDGTTELSENIQDLQQNLDLQQQMMSSVTSQETFQQTNAQNQVQSSFDANQTQAITQLVEQQTALEASYQALSMVESTNLLKYLSTS